MTAIYTTSYRILLAAFLLFSAPVLGRERVTAQTTLSIARIFSPDLRRKLPNEVLIPAHDLWQGMNATAQTVVNSKPVTTIRLAIANPRPVLKSMSDLLKFHIAAIPVALECDQNRFSGWELSLKCIVNRGKH